MKKKILLMGGNRYSGRNIIENLENHYDITKIGRNDLIDFDTFKEINKNKVYDVLINAIVEYEITNISSLIESNFYLVFKVYDQINKSDKFKLIQFGSFYSKFSENNVRDHYLLSKESLLKYSKLLNFISNTSVFYLQLEHVIGPNESVKKFNGWLKHSLQNDLEITLGPCDHSFDFIHINDIIDLIRLLVDTKKFKNEFKLFEVGSGKSTMLRTFVLKLKNKLNSNSKITFSKGLIKKEYKNESSISNINELIDLGWKPKNDINDIIDAM